MASGEKGILPQIVVAVTIALIAGGSAPWWWDELISRGPTKSPSRTPIDSKLVDPSKPAISEKSESIVSGTMRVTASVIPTVVSRGQITKVNVFVQDAQGNPIPSATVSLTAGGGYFSRTETSAVSGSTDSTGVFKAKWKCDQCAPSYKSRVRVTKPDYEEAKEWWRIKISN
jgi:hypothetical protein